MILMRSLMRRRILGGIAAIAIAGGNRPAWSQSTDKGPVLVFGATGKLGADIVRSLVAGGNRVTAFTRATSSHDLLKGLDVAYVTGDLFNRADVVAACKSARFRAVIVALRVEDNDLHFYEKAMANIATGAKEGGVKQVIHHSAVGAGENAKQFANLGWEKVPDLLARMKDQGVGEDLIKASGAAYTIIRNSRVWPDKTPATGKAELTEDQSVLNPMTRADLAILTMKCLDNTACFNKTYHVKDTTLTWPPPKEG